MINITALSIRKARDFDDHDLTKFNFHLVLIVTTESRDDKPLSGRWQAPAAVLSEGPKNIGDRHSRAQRAREWPKHASPRARRARGRAKLSLRFGACQCYYMFFTIQPKIAIFMAQLKYLNDGQNP